MHVLSLASKDLSGFFAQWVTWHSAGIFQSDAVLHYVWQHHQIPTLDELRRQGEYFMRTLTCPEEQNWFEENLCVLEHQWHDLNSGWNRLALENECLIFNVVIDSPLSTLQAASGKFKYIVLHADFFNSHRKIENTDQLPEYTAACIKFLCHWHTQLQYVEPGNKVQLEQWNKQLKSSGWTSPKKSINPCPSANTKTHLWKHLIYEPHWHKAQTPKKAQQKKAIVIGAGLSGAAAAYSLARRGWEVEVLDENEQPAGGASGLPVGLAVPHVSADDTNLSQISRAGIRCTLQRASQLLQHELDWSKTGVVEHCVRGKLKLPKQWIVSDKLAEQTTYTKPQYQSSCASSAQKKQVGLLTQAVAIWHSCAAWIKPANLVNALLKRSNITFKGKAQVEKLKYTSIKSSKWQALDKDGVALAEGDIVVLAAGFGCQKLLQELSQNTAHHKTDQTAPYGIKLTALRGQIAWQWHNSSDDLALPKVPISGKGSMAAHIPFQHNNRTGNIWISGSTFNRDNTDTKPNDSDLSKLLENLRILCPKIAQYLQPNWNTQKLQSWAGIRATLPDRLPIVGQLNVKEDNGLYACSGMGARGLTMAILCGEQLAGQLNNEPSTLPKNLARMLAASRWHNKSRKDSSNQ